jgi:cytochrome b561
VRLQVVDIQNGADGDKWASFGYLVLLLLMFRVLVLCLYWWPWDSVVQRVSELLSTRTEKVQRRVIYMCFPVFSLCLLCAGLGAGIGARVVNR